MNQLKIAIKAFLFMTVLTGIIYPLFITIVAQFMMPFCSNGSLVFKENQIVGSTLIAQNFTDDRYFWPRPSAIDYDPVNPSGGSNLGPTSQKLKKEVEARKQKLGGNAPAELLFASGSGLDPHISVETAYFQMARVAQARDIDEATLKSIILEFSEGKQLGFLGPSYINVLLLNKALDER